jgi:FkbM family methyltransferase
MKTAQTEWGPFIYFDEDMIGAHLASGSFWDEHLRPWFDAMGPEKVFVDAGANIGFFSVYCGRRGAEVYAFEASPEVFHLLLHNVQEHGLSTSVHTHNVALFDCVCEVAIMPDHYGWGGYPTLEGGRIDFEKIGNGGAFAVSPIAENESRAYRMITATLDSFTIQNVSLLKTDVQGSDLRVLKGARGTIERCRPMIIFEYEPAPSTLLGDELARYMEFFKLLDYSVENIHLGDFIAKPIEKVA